MHRTPEPPAPKGPRSLGLPSRNSRSPRPPDAAIPVIWRVDANAVLAPSVDNIDLDYGSPREPFGRA
eukprot:8575297-Lingulodinium_polyedra.AAC.1